MNDDTEVKVDTSIQLKGALFPKMKLTATVLAALYHVFYVARIFDRFDIDIDASEHRMISIASILVVVFLFYSATGSRKRDKLPWYDGVLILLSLITFGYGVVGSGRIFTEAENGTASPATVAMFFIGILVLGEAGRRTIGLPMVIISLVLVVYSHFANYLPGILNAPHFPPAMVAYTQYVTPNGLFGVPIGVFATLIIMFVLFANFLRLSGAGDFFIDLAFSLVGHIRGGPAKAAVVASGLFGMISGSASANAATTGSITIPLMKKIGLSSAFAGGVEAAAATGGLIMPPVMGAVAFIMADWLQMRYIDVCIVAAIPALFYYVAIYFAVDGEAQKLGLTALPREGLPRFGKTIREGWYHLVPVAFLIILLGALDVRADLGALYTVLFIIALSLLRKKTRMGPRKIMEAMQEGVIGSIPAGISCALAGVILGAITQTALGAKLSGGILDLSGGSLFLILLLTAACSTILGMGMPAVPIYIILVSILAPAISDLGVPLIAAHLFIFYYGTLSFITPPVATAAFTAAALAGSPPILTACYASRIGMVAFIIPFYFIYNPGLLLIGSSGEIARASISAVVGIAAIVFASVGYGLGKKINWWTRIILASGGGLLFSTSWKFDSIGLGIVAVGIVSMFLLRQPTTVKGDLKISISTD